MKKLSCGVSLNHGEGLILMVTGRGRRSCKTFMIPEDARRMAIALLQEAEEAEQAEKDAAFLRTTLREVGEVGKQI